MTYNVCAITTAGAEHNRLESHIYVILRTIIVSRGRVEGRENVTFEVQLILRSLTIDVLHRFDRASNLRMCPT